MISALGSVGCYTPGVEIAPKAQAILQAAPVVIANDPFAAAGRAIFHSHAAGIAAEDVGACCPANRTGLIGRELLGGGASGVRSDSKRGLRAVPSAVNGSTYCEACRPLSFAAESIASDAVQRGHAAIYLRRRGQVISSQYRRIVAGPSPNFDGTPGAMWITCSTAKILLP